VVTAVEDAEIVGLYWRRSETAISETEKKYGAYCHTIAEQILHNTQDADECVNDTWLRAWNGIPPQRPIRLRMFLAKITRNLAFDRYQAQRAGKRGGGETDLILEELKECVSTGETAESPVMARELEQTVNQFVHTLPERDCNVFVRRYFFAEPVEAISKRYGLSANHVMVILCRTRKKLKAHLKREGYLS